MKKSVVAAVAASNLTVFSGLVNAQGSGNGSGTDFGQGEPCVMVTEPELGIDGNQIFIHCYFPNPGGVCEGKCWIFDEEQWNEKKVKCTLHTSKATSAICDALNPPTPQIA